MTPCRSAVRLLGVGILHLADVVTQQVDTYWHLIPRTVRNKKFATNIRGIKIKELGTEGQKVGIPACGVSGVMIRNELKKPLIRV